MPDSAVDTPHFQVPFNFTADGAAVVEQDSDDDIVQCVSAVCRTPRGMRLESPDFGIDELVLREQGPDKDKLERAIVYWEPRARVSIDLSNPNVMDSLYQLVNVNVGGAF